MAFLQIDMLIAALDLHFANLQRLPGRTGRSIGTARVPPASHRRAVQQHMNVAVFEYLIGFPDSLAA